MIIFSSAKDTCSSLLHAKMVSEWHMGQDGGLALSLRFKTCCACFACCAELPSITSAFLLPLDVPFWLMEKSCCSCAAEAAFLAGLPPLPPLPPLPLPAALCSSAAAACASSCCSTAAVMQSNVLFILSEQMLKTRHFYRNKAQGRKSDHPL